MDPELYFARRSFVYGTPPKEKRLDLGQVTELAGCRGDRKLIDLAYLTIVPRSIKPCQCGKCGAWFYDEGFLSRHGRKRHENVDAQKMDAMLDAEDRYAEVNLPLRNRHEEPIEVTTAPAPRKRGRPRKTAAAAA